VFDRTSMREATVALLLAAVTGYFDAVGFTRLFSVFVANQSGNVILFGIGLGDTDWAAVWPPALSMVGFVAGVAVGLVLAGRIPEPVRPVVLLGVETALIVVVAAVAGNLAGQTPPVGGTKEVVLLGLGSLAMGVQTDVIRQVARVSVATTYQSGALVRIASELADVVVHARLAPTARKVLLVLGGMVAAYVVGAALGSAVVEAWGHGLWASAALVGLVGVWLWRSPLRTVEIPDA
jgi:uncharacterized membrane protein YoaK (UPF0700 family)